MKRKAIAVWNGDGKDGNGFLTTQSLTLNNTPYSFRSRFAEGTGTNPEELLAAAHAGCFTMKLSFVLGEAGFVPEQLETSSVINFENGTTITASHLIIQAKVPGISEEIFSACVKDAEKNCPVSKVLNAAISSEFTLNS
ncbi:OsmC family protein [Pollutibacter soli]|uniref:OsmC family protein n=1 Tax=Pollutibacter soli TaxID=3034157 RepID=UPI003013B5C6